MATVGQQNTSVLITGQFGTSTTGIDVLSTSFPYPAVPYAQLGIPISVKDPVFGAKGDGITDDTAAIQAAINSLSSQGGQVIFPPGVYIVSQPIIINSGQYLIGSGPLATIIRNVPRSATALLQTANYASLIGTNNPAGPYKFGLINMSFDGNSANVIGTANAIQMYGYNFVIDNVHIYNATLDGLRSEWSTNGTVPVVAGGDSMEAHVSKLKVFSNGKWGLEWLGPHDSVFTDVLAFINGNGGSGGGISFNASANNNGNSQVTEIHCYGNTGPGISIAGGVTVWGDNIQSEFNVGTGIVVDATSVIIANTLNCFNNTVHGIQISGGESIIDGAKLTGNGGNGIVILAGNNSYVGAVISAFNTGTGVLVSGGSANAIVGAISTGNGVNYNLVGGTNSSANF